jgi:hypothetical protein
MGAAETVAPVFHRDTGSMDFAAANLEPLVIQEEVGVTNGESVFGGFTSANRGG